MELMALVIASLRPSGDGPEAFLSRWRALSLAPERFRDWPEGDPMFSSPAAAPTVGALLDTPLESDEAPSFLEVELGAGSVEITGVLSGEALVISHQLSVASALREALEAGVEGDAALVFPALGGALFLGAKPSKGKGKAKKVTSTFELAPMQQFFQNERLSRAYLLLDGWLADKRATPSLRRAPYREAESRYWLEAPTAAEDRALELARRLDAAALGAALADPWVCAPRLEALRLLTPDAAALSNELASGSPLARTLAIALVAHADGERADPLARELLGHPSRYVARAALRALAHARSDAALDALLDAIRAPRREWIHAIQALGRSPHPEVGARLSALLASDVVVLDLEALPATEREARVTGAQRVLEAVVSRADRAFVPRLFELFDDPKMRWLVPYLCNVLARIGGPEVEARGQEIQAAMLGMGRALNQDVARRAELLGIAVDARSSGGIQKYRDLDVARFERLLEEGFIHPQAAQNAAPSPAELFALMREHPEILAQGYAVLPSRADYRAMVDGISCELRGLPGERAEAIRQVFTSLSERASNAELDGDSIALWWT